MKIAPAFAVVLACLAAVCATPTYSHITSGSCASHNLASIQNAGVCHSAVRHIGLSNSDTSSTSIDADMTDCALNNTAYPTGCLLLIRQAMLSERQTIVADTQVVQLNRASRTGANCSHTVSCLCARQGQLSVYDGHSICEHDFGSLVGFVLRRGKYEGVKIAVIVVMMLLACLFGLCCANCHDFDCLENSAPFESTIHAKQGPNKESFLLRSKRLAQVMPSPTLAREQTPLLSL